MLRSPDPHSTPPARRWGMPPLVMSLLLLSAAVGSVVLVGIATVTVVPLLIGLIVVAGWITALLLLAWAGIEALAALERWLENDPRFRR